VFLYRRSPKEEDIQKKNPINEVYNDNISIESNARIFFVLRQSPRVESGRAPTHHASVPQKEGEQVEFGCV
jgi:hypothetical protein